MIDIDIVKQALPGIIIAIFAAPLTAYCTSKAAWKKFFSEKWWEEKKKAYEEIIDALYDLLQYCQVKKEDFGEGTGLLEGKMKALSDHYDEASWKIKKTIDVGALVVSPEAIKILKELNAKPQLKWDENPPWEIFDQDYKNYQNALVEICEVAKKDLKSTRV